MSWFALLVAFFIGAGTVAQGGINKDIGKSWGLASAVLFNNTIVAILSLLIFILVKIMPQKFPELFRPSETTFTFQWHYIIPALCGLAVVVGIPWAINQIGAVKVFLVMIAAQIIASVLWDLYVEGISLSSVRIVGILLAIAGTLLTFVKK